MPQLVKRYVLNDAYCWNTPVAGRPDRFDHHVGRKGDVIEITAEEAARGEGLGVLSADAADVEEAVAAGIEPPSWSDVELDSANVEDTVAYLVQHPTEAGRVLERESSREDRQLKVRKGVVEAAERVQVAHDEQVEADAEARRAAEDAEQAAYAQTAGGSPPAPRIP